MEILRDDPLRGDVLALLTEHLSEMRATSPPESVHALEAEALSAPGITFWTVRERAELLGCGALKALDPTHVEIKSMRTGSAARRRGVAGRLLDHLVATARAEGRRRVSLETGAEDFFAPARSLYASRGFTVCGPFGSYADDPNSVFMTLEL
jgi:putative acetyltransferase